MGNVANVSHYFQKQIVEYGMTSKGSVTIIRWNKNNSNNDQFRNGRKQGSNISRDWLCERREDNQYSFKGQSSSKNIRFKLLIKQLKNTSNMTIYKE